MKRKLLTLALLALLTQADAQRNLLSAIKGENGIAKQLIEFSEQDQLAFAPRNAKLLLGLDAKSDLVLYKTEKDKLGFIHYRFYQAYAGIPVENTMFIAHVKDGKIVSASASLVTDFSADMPARSAVQAMPGREAVEKAIRHAGATLYAWQDAGMEAAIKEQKGKNATYYPTAEKVWYSVNDLLNPSALKLAYKIDIYTQEPQISRAYYFIDAQTGILLGRENRIHTTDAVGTATTLYSGNRTIHSDKTGTNTYRLHDYTRGKGIITRKATGGADYINTSANWTNLTLPDQNALDAHWGVEMTYDFYKVNFNRNSIDDSGFVLYSNVNKGGFLYKDNASWDGTAMNYGTRSGSQNGVTGIDVTAHELTHGVTEYTCGLVYAAEPGAINESLSDMMGKSVQFWAKPDDIDWRLSNDMGWVIRDLSNPNAENQPDTYQGTFWVKTTGSCNFLNDNCGVHSNSGVGNFMFYLLVEGGSGTNDIGNNYSVQGIGLEKAYQIIYRAQTEYLTPTSQYLDLGKACYRSAIELYGRNSAESKEVRKAFYAVGIGPSPAKEDIVAADLKQVITLYPNPVNGAGATVKFNLEKAGDITLKVYDRFGNAVQIYNLRMRPKGEQSYLLGRAGELKMGDYYIGIEQDGILTGRLKFLVVK